jgi:putative transcriptional regulator
VSHDFLDLDPDNPLAPAPGRLLVSGPYLPDPYFRRTVVLLCEHDAEGSFGFVLNRAMDMQVNDLVPSMASIHSRVFMGGPVHSDNLYFLHTLGAHVTGSEDVVDGVRVGGDHEQLRDLLSADHRLLQHVRFFVGYSGWSAGQLDQEIEERSWFVAPGSKRSIMASDHHDLWQRTLRNMGTAFAALANFPEDPGLN